ncbi:CENP-B protein, partial [Tuber magnatum]
WVSILECISASGRSMYPMVIFKGKVVKTTWFMEDDTPNWLIATSSKGWTVSCIALCWLHEIFLPETTSQDSSGRSTLRPHLLILDGHGSHVTIEFMGKYWRNNVELLFLPANSSYVLHSLDLSASSILKTEYQREIADLACLDDTAPVKKQRFVQCYEKAQAKTFAASLLCSGWVAVGLYL